MSRFLHHLVKRHSNPGPMIMPRLPGVFESVPIHPFGADENMADKQDQAIDIIPRLGPDQISLQPNRKSKSDYSQENLKNELNSKPSVPSILSGNEEEIRSKLAPSSFRETKAEPAIKKEFQAEVFPVKASSLRNEIVTPDVHVLPTKEEMMKEILEQLKEVFPSASFPDSPTHSSLSKPLLPDFSGKDFQAVNRSTLSPGIQQQEATSVKIHIGKIEIKAIRESNAPVLKPVRPKPEITLDQYLEQRKPRT